MLIATIDAGTSNTRVFLWQDTTILAEAQMPIGVRHTAIDRHNKKLTAAVRDTLREAARKAGVTMDDIACILGAGMLTSNVGLKEIPHLAAPISLDALSHAIVPCHLPEICPQVIHLIPGIKNMDDMSFTDETIGHMDIMRGEETEAAAILQCFPSIEHMVLVLPGSHNKYIAVSNGDTICGCLTTLAGELLHAMTFDTILASSTAQSYAEHYDAEAFQRGVVCRRQSGFGHAAFMARILDLFDEATPNVVQNYLLGILLADDLIALRRSPLFPNLSEAVFIIAGNPLMQAAYKTLLASENYPTRSLDQDTMCALSGRGAIALARRASLFREGYA